MSSLFDQAKQLNSLRKLLGWSTIEEALKDRLSLEIVERPVPGKVLVLAPHPDDDIFGAGGTIARHREQGDDVRIIYLCDGRLGTKRTTTELVQEEIKKTRRVEAIRAAEILGLSPAQLTFWSYRDGQLVANKTTTKALTQVLADIVPRTIYVPHPADGDPDHEATARVLAQTLRAIGDLPAEIWSYETKQPTFPNRLVPIGATIDQKRLAIEAHSSQIKYRPYDDAILGLNTYRGAIAGLVEPAEAFLVMKPTLYLRLWEFLRDVNG